MSQPYMTEGSWTLSLSHISSPNRPAQHAVPTEEVACRSLYGGVDYFQTDVPGHRFLIEQKQFRCQKPTQKRRSGPSSIACSEARAVHVKLYRLEAERQHHGNVSLISSEPAADLSDPCFAGKVVPLLPSKRIRILSL